MPEKDAPDFSHVGYISTDGISWTPVGKVESITSTEAVGSCSCLPPSETITLTVSIDGFKWLCRLLGLPRLDSVRAYRRERKGHPRCR